MLILASLALARETPFTTRLRGDAFEAVLREPVGPVFPEGRHEDLLEAATALAPLGARTVRLIGIDAETGREVPVLDRLPHIPPLPDDEVALAPADNPGAADGALTGKAVYLSQCHGWLWGGSAFGLQRPVLHETVEDLHNPEALNQYLTAALENAGARVYTVKERDLQTASTIVDDGEAGYTETGTGFVAGLAGWGRQATYAYGQDPFDAGGTRSFPADGGGTATWSPTVPEDGYYAVYVSWDALSGNAPDAHYRIVHPGGVIDRWFDQRVHGSTWQYVERLWLTAGSSLTVELIADSASSGTTLSADAVRIGGGMETITRGGVSTGRPAWESGGILGAQRLGAPPSVYDPSNDGNGSDPSSRSRWADWEHPTGEDAVYLSWHSNATAAGNARGTSTYYAGGGADSPDSPACSASAVSGSYTLADFVQSELIDQFRGRWEPTWRDRGVLTACFAEVNPSRNDEIPSVLVELAFHDNATDASFLKHPVFRRDSARAMARGILRYFAQQDGVAPVYPPEAPVGISALHDPAGGIRLSWEPGPSGGVDGDAPTGYLVFSSADGKSWDTGFAVTGTTTVVTPPYGARFWRVVATNDGGQSFPSEVVGASYNADGYARVLVVGAFDRLDRGLLPLEGVGAGSPVRRMWLDRVNDGTIVVPHGLGIVGGGWTFDSASDEALSGIDLTAYDVVVWAAGEESTIDESVSSSQQTLLSAYVNQGGGLLVSGAEVLWDLDANGSTTDQTFASDVLGASMQADAASTTTAVGQGVLAGVTLSFGAGPYPVEWPDVLSSTRTTIATYAAGEIAGVIGNDVAMFGFPLDAVDDPAQLDAFFAALLPELGGPAPTTPPPVTPPPVTPLPTPPPPTPTDPQPTDPEPTEPEPTEPEPTEPEPTDPEPTDPAVDTDRPPPTARRVPLSLIGDRGCGCASAVPAPLGLVGLAGLLLFIGRRREHGGDGSGG